MTATCAAPGCGKPLTGRRRRFCSDLCRIRGQRSERTVETHEFGQAAIRMIRQMSKRVGASDLAQFGALFDVLGAADSAVVDAIADLREAGFSYTELAREVGWSRQRLTQWYERRASAYQHADRNNPLRGDAAVAGG